MLLEERREEMVVRGVENCNRWEDERFVRRVFLFYESIFKFLKKMMNHQRSNLAYLNIILSI